MVSSFEGTSRELRRECTAGTPRGRNEWIKCDEGPHKNRR